MGKTYKGSCFCGAVEIAVTGESARDGYLPLLVVPQLVGRAGQQVQPLEDRDGDGHQGRGAHRRLSQDAEELPQVLQDLRRAPA